MKLLFVSNLFPDSKSPVRGLDNATLLHTLRREYSVVVKVISPRPALRQWVMPISESGLSARYDDKVFLIDYPNVRYLPKIGSRWNDTLMLSDIQEAFSCAVEEFKPDLVLASWLYPDGCAVVRACREANIPALIITQGTDSHRYLLDTIRREKIKKAILGCEGVICRSRDLAALLEEAGAPDEKLHVIYNGVDLSIFRPRDKQLVRSELGIPIDEPNLLFVGNFLPVKNPELLLDVHADLNSRRKSRGESPVYLTMIGDGPLRGMIEKKIRENGNEQMVRLMPRMPSEKIALWMSASDVFCMTSRNEGFPNVLLEAIATELPIVSTNVGGISEKVHPPVGKLVKPGDKSAFVVAVEAILGEGFDKNRSDKVEGADLSWSKCASQYFELCMSTLESRAGEAKI